MAHRAVNLRLDDELIALLDALVARDRAKIDAIGLDAEANYSTVLRRLIKTEAKQEDVSSPVATKKKPAAKGKR